ncbi:preprotein translocase subunit SecG [Xaviernesmea oryzae]|uniref:Protein-export membrane protein SecG n=1 Tax=Xaviernesmea oryzae TaxID=464029 RepID=A0A1Q9AXA4_9HYPH|nr:preprotein translocase subunit SecG [Xaviernesmea oryzae]OLP60073.1 preprotein translocase subunit SecG [Xaviernesmea oryzae]SEK37680.1 preprotein translocase subunit SecG [Xaviernesmea oryzae]
MQTILLVIYLMVVLALIGVVLIQRSEGGGLGIGGGSGFMSARGAANALTRTTAILATLFFVLALAMGILARYQPTATDVLDRIPGTTGTGNGVLDSLGPNGQAPASQAPGTTAPATQAPAGQAAPTQPGQPATGVPQGEAPVQPSAPASTAPAAPATGNAPAAPAATPPATNSGVPSGQ